MAYLIRTDGFPIVDLTPAPGFPAPENVKRIGRHRLTYYQSEGGSHAVHYELFEANPPNEVTKEAFCFVDPDFDICVAKAARHKIYKLESIRSDIESDFDTIKGIEGAYLLPEYAKEWHLYFQKRSEQIQLAYTTALSEVLPKEVVA